jgi:serine/threonine-protein kinase
LDRAEELFHAALEMTPANRGAFLKRSCGSDEALRRDVESLLAADNEAGDFAERPAMQVLAEHGGVGPDAIGPGTHIGRYKVQELVGTGGLGAVYKAFDSALGRSVAVKVLHRHIAYVASSRTRIEQEGRTLAGLSHPHICPVFDVGTHDDVSYLVMEHLVGETLAERLAREVLTTDEALRYAIEIADALDAAHRRGIVHRDVKPANVMLTADGAKLLDFGLAKGYTAAPDRDRVQRTPAQGRASALTTDGPALGTPQYMSPEQIRGIEVDARADLFAFGAVLFEMLTGTRAFTGNTPAELATAITTRTPPRVSSVRPSVPAALDRLVERCLARQPEDRWATAGDVRQELATIQRSAAEARGASRSPTLPSRRHGRWRMVAASVVFASAGGAVAAWLLVQQSPPAPVAPRESWLRVGLPADAPYVPLLSRIEVSADGSQLLYPAPNGLTIRSLDRLPVAPLGLGNIVGSALLSPNGRYVAYIDDEVLRIRATFGRGAGEIVASGFRRHTTGSWAGDGHVLIADERGLWRVPAKANARPVLLKMDPLEPGRQILYPTMLPGGRHVLGTVARSDTFPMTAARATDARVEVVDLETGARRILARQAGMAAFVPSGHLAYAAGGDIRAIRFDQRRMVTIGDSVRIISGSFNFAVSADGTIVYAENALSPNRTLVWVDRSGKEEALDAPPMPYAYPRLSPDDSSIAVDVNNPGRDIFTWDLRGKAGLLRFTEDDSTNYLLAWTRDGQRIAFGSERSGVSNLFIQDVRTWSVQRLTTSTRVQMPLSFTPEGRLLFSEEVPGRGRDIRALSMDGTGAVTTIVGSAATEGMAEVSPDGQWLAYDSEESERFEVYLARYGPGGATERRVVSTAGGRQPLWSRSGRELYYRDFAGAVLMITVPSRHTSTIPAPIEVVKAGPYMGAGSLLSGRMYDIARDRRFLMVKNSRDGEPPALIEGRGWLGRLSRQ